MPDTRPTVLVIDDNAVDRERVVRLLGSEFTALCATTGAEGRALFEEERPDCVLLDYRLPDVIGLELLRNLCARDAAVVMLTGGGSESVAVEAMKSGARDYLVKEEMQRDSLRRAVQGTIQRHSLETALDRSESYNRALLSAIPDTMIWIHRDGRLQNMIAGKDSGRAAITDECLGQPLTALLPLAEATPLLDCVARAFASPGVDEVEYLVEQDGKVSAFHARVTVCRGEEAVAIIRNMTRERDMERRMRASQRMEAVGRVAGGVAHDFRNILAVIEGYTVLLQEALSAEQQAHADLSVIQNAVDRGARLVGELLTFSRHQTYVAERIDLDRKIVALSSMLHFVAGRRIQLHTDLAAGNGLIEASSSQLDQVIMNLAVNARDAMPDGGKLTISTHVADYDDADLLVQAGEIAPGRYIALMVADAGQGMDEETRTHIFEPFFTTKEDQGTGLGLATVYGIVQQSNGHIEATSEPGVGSTFTVLFPWLDGTATPSEQASDEQPELVAAGARASEP